MSDLDNNALTPSTSNDKRESIFKILFKHFFITRVKGKGFFQVLIISLVLMLLIVMFAFLPSNETPANPHPQSIPLISNAPLFESISNVSSVLFTPDTPDTHSILSEFNKTRAYSDEKAMFDEVIDGSHLIGISFDDLNLTNETLLARYVASSDLIGAYSLSTILSQKLHSLFTWFNIRSFPSIVTRNYMVIAMNCLNYMVLGDVIYLSSSPSYDVENFRTRNYFMMFINGVPQFTFYVCYGIFLFVCGAPHLIIGFIMTCFVAPSKGTNPLLIIVGFILFHLQHTFVGLWRTPFSYSVPIFVLVIIAQTITSIGGVYGGMYGEYLPRWMNIIFGLFFPGYAFTASLAICYSPEPVTFANWKSTPHGISFAEFFALTFGDTLFWFIVAVVGLLCSKRAHGAPPLGWKGLFKWSAWIQLFNKTIRIASEESTLVTNGLTKIYSNGIKGLSNVSLSSKSGDVVAIIGPNGSGKSTLINTLVGEFDFDSGTVEAFGVDITSNLAQMHPFLGIVFQDDISFPYYVIKQVLDLYGRLQGIPQEELEQRIEKLTFMLGISDKLDRVTTDLSGGEKRKFNIALALLNNPDILFLDEPTTGVDAQSRSLIWKVIAGLKNTTTLITTHGIEEAEYVATRFVVMSTGEVIFSGTPAELRMHYDCGYILTDVSGNASMDELLGAVKETYEMARISPSNPRAIIFPTDEKVWDVLERLESRKASIGLGDYTLHLENLEDTLVKFIMSQEVLIV